MVAYLDYEVEPIVSGDASLLSDAQFVALLAGAVGEVAETACYDDLLRAAVEADDAAAAVFMQDVMGTETSPGKTHAGGFYVHVMER